jgi:hypothetical protein
MIGKNFSIIHKDDKQKWFDFLSKIKLGKKDKKTLTIEYYINKDIMCGILQLLF